MEENDGGTSIVHIFAKIATIKPILMANLELRNRVNGNLFQTT
jgi:hypothetical protein